MASVGENIANTLRNAALTITDMEADNRALRSSLERFIQAFETGKNEPLQIAYEAAKNALEDRRI